MSMYALPAATPVADAMVGAVVLIVIVSPEEASLTLPAASVAVAVMV